MFIKVSLITLLLSTSALLSFGENHSDEMLYRRCYTLLSNRDLPRGDARLAQVKNGTLTPAEACRQVAETATLNPTNGRLQNSSTLGVSVLNTMHNLHFSWLTTKTYNVSRPAAVRPFYNYYDITAPALHVTNALFNPQKNARSILKTSQVLTSIRDANGNLLPSAASPLSKTIFKGTNLPYVKVGNLIGIKPKSTTAFPWRYDARGTPQTGTYNLGRTYGGGVLGSPVYLQTTVTNFQPADGGLKMPRTWARNLYQDYLCRELPLVRPGDTTNLVDTNSPIGFRASNSCVGCHASMDRAASVIRHLTETSYGVAEQHGMRFINPVPANKPNRTLWPATPDPDYKNRPRTGKVFYRGYNGNLVNANVNNLSEFATELANRPEFYVCLAKRYYKYFTGVDANINDKQLVNLNGDETKHRNKVIQMGLELKRTGNLLNLIEEVLESKQYLTGSPN